MTKTRSSRMRVKAEADLLDMRWKGSIAFFFIGILFLVLMILSFVYPTKGYEWWSWITIIGTSFSFGVAISCWLCSKLGCSLTLS